MPNRIRPAEPWQIEVKEAHGYAVKIVEVELLDAACHRGQLQVRSGLDGLAEAGPEERMILDDPDRYHVGTHNVTLVPRPGVEATCAWPPTSSRR